MTNQPDSLDRRAAATDLPLTNPANPLHRPATQSTPIPADDKGKKAVAATTAKKVTAKAKSTKATASAKPPHQPSTIKSTDVNPSKSIVPPKFKALYAVHQGTNGDNVALALKAMEVTNENGRSTIDWATMQAIAKANDIDLSAYAHLNAGQKRMNLGNKLRGMVKAGKSVVIGKKRIANLKAAEAASAQAKAA